MTEVAAEAGNIRSKSFDGLSAVGLLGTAVWIAAIGGAGSSTVISANSVGCGFATGADLLDDPVAVMEINEPPVATGMRFVVLEGLLRFCLSSVSTSKAGAGGPGSI